MFNLTDLYRVTITIDLSNYLKPAEPDFDTNVLEKITLKTLKKSPVSSLRLSLERISKDLPVVEYSGIYKDYRVLLRLFHEKKLLLDIRKGTSTIISTESITKEKVEDFPSKEKMDEINNSFNYVFGTVVGLLGITKKLDVVINIAFQQNVIGLPSKKLQLVADNLSSILGAEKIALCGIQCDIFENGIKHEMEFSQNEKFYSRDEYTLTSDSSPPLVLWDILKGSLNLINKYIPKIK
jgi:hypothetical protein